MDCSRRGEKARSIVVDVAEAAMSAALVAYGVMDEQQLSTQPTDADRLDRLRRLATREFESPRDSEVMRGFHAGVRIMPEDDQRDTRNRGGVMATCSETLNARAAEAHHKYFHAARAEAEAFRAYEVAQEKARDAYREMVKAFTDEGKELT